MTMTMEDLKIDKSLNNENALEKGFAHRLDVLIDPKHPEWNMDDVMKWVSAGYTLGVPANGDERYVGVYEATEPGEDTQPVDLLGDGYDGGNDD